MKLFLTLVLPFFLIVEAQAASVPVSADYTISGTSGDYTLDFTFKSHLINSQDAPADWIFYQLGVSLPGSSIIGRPSNYTTLGQQGNYNAVWAYDNPTHTGLAPLYPTTEQAGFLMHSTDTQPPSIASWFMTGSAQPGNGLWGFQSRGKYLGQSRATLFGSSTGVLLAQAAPLTAVPIPGAVWLFASGLLVLFGWRQWRSGYSL